MLGQDTVALSHLLHVSSLLTMLLFTLQRFESWFQLLLLTSDPSSLLHFLYWIKRFGPLREIT